MVRIGCDSPDNLWGQSPTLQGTVIQVSRSRLTPTTLAADAASLRYSLGASELLRCLPCPWSLEEWIRLKRCAVSGLNIGFDNHFSFCGRMNPCLLSLLDWRASLRAKRC